ncbi:MAG TPA: polysaccharide lyase family 8 super-sandwich domain-containing protein, partial [Phycisphaeraceae bacterium]
MAALLLLRERFVRSVLPTRREDMEAIHRIAAEHAASMDATGRWNDLHYDSGDRAIWSGAAHLDRVLRMAKSARLRREAGRPDAAMTAQAVTALKAWTDADPQNPNWWWNRIGVPELVGEIACLLWDDLPTDQRSAVIRILERSKMDRMTGANLTWCAINRVLLGCLSGSEQVTREAYDRLYEEVRIVGAQEEGIQADYSFHQHGKQFYSGGYGLFFANDVGRFIYIAHGTPFEIPSAKRAVFDGYMLDGMRWMTWGNVLDYSTMGRVITRPNVLAAPTDWSLGPISPAGPAYSLGNVVRLLAELPGPRQAEYAAYAADLAQSPNAPVFEGNRHFWRSDYMAHRRAEYLATVKMFSTRTLNGEIVNGEGRKSHHLSDGANFLYITGQEYKDIFPAWDWQKVPGTTAEQVGDGSAQQMNTIEPKPVGTRGWTDFVGGVSDGRYGLCVMHLQRGALSARKAWFFFDDAYACLGTGITIQNEHPAVTTVNQTHLDGPVRAAGKASPLTPGKRYELDGAAWVHHGRV